MPKWTTPTGNAANLCLDILSQPHTLIAGATGSGKSVAINNIMYTALYKSPMDCNFILIDPKRTELAQYEKLPHTLYYTDSRQEAVEALRKALVLIDTRYREAKKKGLREYPGSHVYIIIDELGDLVFSDKKAVSLLADIAMIGRASRVHLIAATQCPNRKTLSAEFSANCTGRLALRCDDAIESRQIIKTKDAVNLPQYGYGYYSRPGLQLHMVAVDMIPENELAARVLWWTQQTPRLYSLYKSRL